MHTLQQVIPVESELEWHWTKLWLVLMNCPLSCILANKTPVVFMPDSIMIYHFLNKYLLVQSEYLYKRKSQPKRFSKLNLFHRALLLVISTLHTCRPKWYIKLLKAIKNWHWKCLNVPHHFLLGNIKILWKLRGCHIDSLDFIIKRLLGCCKNSALCWIRDPPVSIILLKSLFW